MRLSFTAGLDDVLPVHKILPVIAGWDGGILGFLLVKTQISMNPKNMLRNPRLSLATFYKRWEQALLRPWRVAVVRVGSMRQEALAL